jgi:hypothetical protein
MGGSGLAKGKRWELGGKSPRASLRAEGLTKVLARLLHVCTTFSSPFSKASPRPDHDWLRRSVDRRIGLQISSFCTTGVDETNRHPPASAPPETFLRCHPQDTAKFDYAAKVLHLRKEDALRPLTGALCLPQLPLSITTFCLSALRCHAWSTASPCGR